VPGISFTFTIGTLFRLSDGRTVLVGTVGGVPGPPLLRRSRCELLVDGDVLQTLEIEGEVITEREVPDDRRSVTTRDEVALTQELIEERVCTLRCRSVD
jgi:hypothetical protein